MAAKRKSVVGRAGKKARKSTELPEVMKAITKSEVLPESLRSLFAKVLPEVLSTDKVDRHTYANEVVGQAENSLGQMKADLEAKLKGAREKKAQLISPAERSRREAAKTQSEGKLKAATATLEARVSEAKAAVTANSKASSALKDSEKVFAKAEAEWSKAVAAKDALSGVVTGDMEVLRGESCRSANGKKALKAVSSMGKTCGLGNTILQTFGEACKHDAAARTEFETTTFTTLMTQFGQKVEISAQTCAGLEADKAQKAAGVDASMRASTAASEAVKATDDAQKAAKTAVKDAESELRQAAASVLAVWGDMKAACDLVDKLTGELKEFNEGLMPKFLKLKEKAPEPEPVEEPPAEAPAAPAAAPAAVA